MRLFILSLVLITTASVGEVFAADCNNSTQAQVVGTVTHVQAVYGALCAIEAKVSWSSDNQNCPMGPVSQFAVVMDINRQGQCPEVGAVISGVLTATDHGVDESYELDGSWEALPPTT